MEPNAVEAMVAQIEGVSFILCGCKHIHTIINSKPAVMMRREIKDRNNCIEYLCYMNPKNEELSLYDPLISRCVDIAFTILMMTPKES